MGEARVLVVGPKPILRPNDKEETQAEYLEPEKLLEGSTGLLAPHTFTELYVPHVLQKAEDPRPAMEALWNVARHEGLLELTVPHGSCDQAIADPTYRRLWYPDSMNHFQPAMLDSDEWKMDWQPRVVYIRIHKHLYDTLDETARFQMTMTHRNVALEICAVLQAVKPARSRTNKKGLKFPRIVVQPWEARTDK